MAAGNQSDASAGRLAAACLIVVCLCLTLCVGAGGLAVAWLKLPALNNSADYVYACAGVNLHGRLRVGIGWNANLAGMGVVMIALPQSVCGYWPLPPFIGTYGTWIYQL